MSSKFSEIKSSLEIKPAIKQEGKEIKTELEKPHKDTKDQKDKEQKEHKDKEQKEHKDIKDQIKEHKHELPEKTHKDLEKASAETAPPQTVASLSQPANLAQATFVPKHVDKLFKFEKFEKFEKHEKFEKNEKHEFPEFPIGSFDPGGPVEQRLAALESAMAQLMHFIPESLRPDLSSGALKQEEDVKPAQADKGAAPSTPTQPEKPEAPSDKGKK
jgi:hypothetical protein